MTSEIHSQWCLVVPFWSLAAVTGVPAVVFGAVGWRSRRRHARIKTRPLLLVRLRPSRHARAVPGVRCNTREGFRMKRRLFTILSAISLLLFVAVVVMWVRSYVSPGSLGVIPLPNEGERTSGFSAVRGEIRWVTFRGMSQDENRAASGWRRDWVLVTAGEVGAVSPAQPVQGVFLRRQWVGVPFWAPALLLALVTAATARGTMLRVMEDRRRRRGLCPSCGYDLRATPGRCPECGTAANAPSP